MEKGREEGVEWETSRKYGWKREKRMGNVLESEENVRERVEKGFNLLVFWIFGCCNEEREEGRVGNVIFILFVCWKRVGMIEIVLETCK